MTGAADQSKAAMSDKGYSLPGGPVPDGNLHRFSHEDRNSGTAGWYVFHADGIPAGSFGDWRSGRKFKWCAKGESEFTPAEREDLRRRIEQQKAERQRAENQARDKAAKRARQAWDAAQPPNPDHPYLSKKGVSAGYKRPSTGARPSRQSNITANHRQRWRQAVSVGWLQFEVTHWLEKKARERG